MNKYNRLFILVTVLLLLLLVSACSARDGDIISSHPLSVAITAQNFISAEEGMTRTIDEGYHTSFKDGDKVGIFVIDNKKGEIKQDNIPYCFMGSTNTWRPEKEDATFYEGAYYLVYYPYQEQISYAIDRTKDYAYNADRLYSVFVSDWKFNPNNQETEELYTSMDLMIGQATVATGDDGQLRLNVVVGHRLALVLVDMRQKLASGGTKAVKPYMEIGWEAKGWMTPDSIYRLLIKSSENINLMIAYNRWQTNEYLYQTTVSVAPGKYLRYNITIPE